MRQEFLLIPLFLIAPSFLHAAETPRNYTFAELVQKEKKAIVHIKSTKLAREGGGPLKDFFFPGNQLRSEVRDGSLGTGFFIDSSGLILTNNHVIAPTHRAVVEELIVETSDRRAFRAKVIGRDVKTDVALLKIEKGGPFHSTVLGDSDRLEVGEWVIAIGNAFGMEETVTVGVVSGVGRALGTGPYDNFIQTDAAINAGNSGGPLYNLHGEVVGISTAVSTSTQGIGFAIPIEMVRKILPSLQSEGKVVRGWLGVMIQQLTLELAKAFRLSDDQGALVSQVMERSPAERAGILRGDVIVEYDGKTVGRMHELPSLVAETPIGKTVPVRIIRDGTPVQLKVKIVRLKEEEEE
ncbi:MAG: trypsin-like peptidase domain-containing protein [Candidatus Manganitrophaceae bacterium]